MKKSNKILAFITCFCIFFSACNRKHSCKLYYSYYKETGIAFVGFQPNELTTIVLNRYKGFTNFVEFIGSDTLHFADSLIWSATDTAYYMPDSLLSKGTFWKLEDSIDYKIELPNSNKNYTISGASNGVPFVIVPDDKEGCLYKGELLPLQNIHLDGNLVYPVWNNNNPETMLIFIKK